MNMTMLYTAGSYDGGRNWHAILRVEVPFALAEVWDNTSHKTEAEALAWAENVFSAEQGLIIGKHLAEEAADRAFGLHMNDNGRIQ